MKGKIHSIESMGLVDGPGIRMVVFMQGCKLRCLYCHNPDTWELNSGKEISSDELIKEIIKYKLYFGDDGGVTFSGGEPLIQPDFLKECLKKCKENNINTCLDTAGQGIGFYGEILDYVDLVIFDVKHYENVGYKNITGGILRESEKFLNVVIEKNIPIWIRHVVIPNLTDSEEHLKNIKKYVDKLNKKNMVKKIELLPYHNIGINKYYELGLEYPLEGVPNMNEEKIKELEGKINT